MIARALVASPTPPAQIAADELRAAYEWVPLDQAEQVVALGGDGFMLQTLHAMLERRRILPVFGMNLGTIGFLMNDWRLERLEERLARAKPFRVSPLSMTATTVGGEQCVLPAINEVSLLRETRQTAKLEVTVNDRVVLEELIADGMLVATPRARPRTTSPPTARSCRSARRCSRSPRSAPSGRGAGAGRSFPRRPASASRCWRPTSVPSAPSPISAKSAKSLASMSQSTICATSRCCSIPSMPWTTA